MRKFCEQVARGLTKSAATIIYKPTKGTIRSKSLMNLKQYKTKGCATKGRK